MVRRSGTTAAQRPGLQRPGLQRTGGARRRRGTDTGPSADRGAVVLVVAVAAAVAGLVAVATAELGVAMVQRQRAQHAADAAALAALDGGREGAARLAAANGARLVSFARRGEVVEVVVALGRARAVAGASDGP